MQFGINHVIWCLKILSLRGLNRKFGLWQSPFRDKDSSSKKEVLDFLSKLVETASFPGDKGVYITSGKTVTPIFDQVFYINTFKVFSMSINSWWTVLLTLSSFLLGENVISYCPRNQMHSCNVKKQTRGFSYTLKMLFEKGPGKKCLY